MAAPTVPAQTVTPVHTNTSSTTAAGTLPTGITQNELLVAQLLVPNATTVSSSSDGYTFLARQAQSTNVSIEVWYKIAGASETSASFTLASSSRNSVAVFRVAGENTSSSWDSSTSSNTGTAGSCTVTGITTQESDELLLVFEGCSGSQTFNTVSGMAELYDSNTGTGPRGLAMCYVGQATQGATGNESIATSAGTPGVAAILAAVRSGSLLSADVGFIPI